MFMPTMPNTPIQASAGKAFSFLPCRKNSRRFGLQLSVLILLGFAYACQEPVQHQHKTTPTIVQNPAKVMKSIFVQPFNGLPEKTTQSIARQLKDLYAGEVMVRPAIPLPENALNSHKKRYRADSLIRYLSTKVQDHQLIIGLTAKDISTTKGQYADWGVMGLGYCPGKSCIASTFRLKGNNRLEKLFKVAIHELGHTQGLKHCPEKTCLMRDAEGKDNLNEQTGFCAHCKPILREAGWDLK